MNPYTNVCLASEKGARLRQLAKHLGTTNTSLLADLIDKACETAGLTFPDAVEMHPHNGLSREGVTSLASALNRIADQGGWCFDLDHDFHVARQGSGVVLKMEAVQKTPGQPGGETIRLKKSMSVAMAHEIARGLRAGLSMHTVH
jgi:hypothetical protein